MKASVGQEAAPPKRASDAFTCNNPGSESWLFSKQLPPAPPSPRFSDADGSWMPKYLTVNRPKEPDQSQGTLSNVKSSRVSTDQPDNSCGPISPGVLEDL